MRDDRTIIETVSAADDAALTQTLAAAFADDPAFCWIMPERDVRLRQLLRLFAIMLKSNRSAGMVLAAPGGEAATLWRAPGRSRAGALETLLSLPGFVHAFGTALPRALAVASAIHAHHPRHDDFWYLQYAGVAPEAQGKGRGSAAIRAGLARADAEAKPVVLETAKPDNVGLYERLGFEVSAEWDVPGDGPRLWTMVRQTRSADPPY